MAVSTKPRRGRDDKFSVVGSPEFLQAVAERAAHVKKSTPVDRWQPEESKRIKVRVLDWDVFASKRRDGTLLGHTWTIMFALVDPTSVDDGRMFRIQYKVRKPQKADQERIVPASRLRELLNSCITPAPGQAMPDTSDETKWPEMLELIKVAKPSIILGAKFTNESWEFKDDDGKMRKGVTSCIAIFGEETGPQEDAPPEKMDAAPGTVAPGDNDEDEDDEDDDDEDEDADDAAPAAPVVEPKKKRRRQ